jgi:hypothetical protein
MTQRVLFTESAEIFTRESVVVQCFAGRVEVSSVRDLRTLQCEVLEELPPLLPHEAAALADNLSHAVRRDPYRIPKDGDESDGSTTLQTTLSSITCKSYDGRDRIRIYTFVEATEQVPGALLCINNIRLSAALKIADALRIAARCAETGEVYERPPPAPVPEPASEEDQDEETRAISAAVPLDIPAPPRIHPAMAARLARIEAREKGEPPAPVQPPAQRVAARFDRAGQRAEWMRKRAGIEPAAPAASTEEAGP